MKKERGRELIWRNNIFKIIQPEGENKHPCTESTEGQKALRDTKKMNPKRSTSRHNIIKKTKIKDKVKILKSTREKSTSYIQENSCKAINWLFSRNSKGQKEVEQYIQSNERKKNYNQKYSSSKAMIHIWRRNKSFTYKLKLKPFSITKLVLNEMVNEVLQIFLPKGTEWLNRQKNNTHI